MLCILNSGWDRGILWGQSVSGVTLSGNTLKRTPEALKVDIDHYQFSQRGCQGILHSMLYKES